MHREGEEACIELVPFFSKLEKRYRLPDLTTCTSFQPKLALCYYFGHQNWLITEFRDFA